MCICIPVDGILIAPLLSSCSACSIRTVRLASCLSMYCSGCIGQSNTIDSSDATGFSCLHCSLLFTVAFAALKVKALLRLPLKSDQSHLVTISAVAVTSAM
jgi:hypothetical protein